MVSKQVIKRCKNQNRKAQRQFYEACAPYLYSIVRSYIYDPSFQKDAMQETFAAIFVSLHHFDPERGSLKPWIGRITVNCCIDMLKKRRKLDLIESGVPAEGAEVSEFDDPTALTRDEIRELLTGMPSGYRTVFLMSVVDGYSHKEIGEALQIKPETSRSQLQRGIQWIRQQLHLSPKTSIHEAF